MINTVTSLNAPITLRAYSAAQLRLFTEEVSKLATDIKAGRLDREFHPNLAGNAESLISQLNEFHTNLERWGHELVTSLESFEGTSSCYLRDGPGEEVYEDLWDELEPTIDQIEEGCEERRGQLQMLPSVESLGTLAHYQAQLEADAAAAAIFPEKETRYAELQEKLKAVSDAIALMRKESLDKLKTPGANTAEPDPVPPLAPDQLHILQVAAGIVLKATDFIEHVLELKQLLDTQKSLSRELAAIREEVKNGHAVMYESLCRRAYLDACIDIERPRQAYLDEVEKLLASLELFCAQQRSPAPDAQSKAERLLAQAGSLANYLKPIAG